MSLRRRYTMANKKVEDLEVMSQNLPGGNYEVMSQNIPGTTAPRIDFGTPMTNNIPGTIAPGSISTIPKTLNIPGTTAPNISTPPVAPTQSAKAEAPTSTQVQPFQSKNQSYIDELLQKIANREPFSYDFNADALYQNYKDQYTKLGNEASMNAAANVSALTGGYGNSYATTAAAQANQQYLTQLNNIIPELQQAAHDMYQSETDDLYRKIGLYQDMDNTDYGRYRDTVSDSQWQDQFAYSKYRDTIADQQWQDQFDYSKYRDTVADQKWQDEFGYQQKRDEIADAKWREEFDTAYNQWLKEFNYQMERDGVSDEQWLKEFNTRYEQWLKEFEYQQQRDKISDEQWERQFNLRTIGGTGGVTGGGTGGSGGKGDKNDDTTTSKNDSALLDKYANSAEFKSLQAAYSNYAKNTNSTNLSDSDFFERYWNSIRDKISIPAGVEDPNKFMADLKARFKNY